MKKDAEVFTFPETVKAVDRAVLGRCHAELAAEKLEAAMETINGP